MSATSIAVTASDRPLGEVAADVLVVPVGPEDTASRMPIRDLDRASGGRVGEALGAGHISTSSGEVTPWPAEGLSARRLLFVGTGPKDGYDADAARRLAGVAARRVMGSAESVALLARSSSHVGPAAEGFLLGGYEPDLHKAERKRNTLSSLVVVGGGKAGAAVGEAAVLASATNLCRDLVSEPPNELTPTILGQRAVEALEPAGIEVEVMTGRSLARFGGLLGVAKGSDEPPVFITMRHTHSRARKSTTLGLIGKGITFDSGGLSLKTNDGMQWMKADMAGAAAVIGAMRAIGELKVPLNVIATIPATENMPSGKATRVGDVLRSYNGKTIEVLNTDAEGRLVLSDALAWTAEQGATHMVDAATLTGAVEVALGNVAFGVMGRPERFVDRVLKSSRRAGERAWPLPLYPEYRRQLDSSVADIKNVGGRPAGTITAAWFLAEFVPDEVQWAHLDIASVAWADGTPHLAGGATGAAVRAFVRIAQDLAAKP